jgi:hypothetical protein
MFRAPASGTTRTTATISRTPTRSLVHEVGNMSKSKKVPGSGSLPLVWPSCRGLRLRAGRPREEEAAAEDLLTSSEEGEEGGRGVVKGRTGMKMAQTLLLRYVSSTDRALETRTEGEQERDRAMTVRHSLHRNIPLHIHLHIHLYTKAAGTRPRAPSRGSSTACRALTVRLLP